jgi:hypothetical protein
LLFVQNPAAKGNDISLVVADGKHDPMPKAHIPALLRLPLHLWDEQPGFDQRLVIVAFRPRPFPPKPDVFRRIADEPSPRDLPVQPALL